MSAEETTVPVPETPEPSPAPIAEVAKLEDVPLGSFQEISPSVQELLNAVQGVIDDEKDKRRRARNKRKALSRKMRGK